MAVLSGQSPMVVVLMMVSTHHTISSGLRNMFSFLSMHPYKITVIDPCSCISRPVVSSFCYLFNKVFIVLSGE